MVEFHKETTETIKAITDKPIVIVSLYFLNEREILFVTIAHQQTGEKDENDHKNREKNSGRNIHDAPLAIAKLLDLYIFFNYGSISNVTANTIY